MPNWIKEPNQPVPSKQIVEAMDLYHKYLSSQFRFEPPITEITKKISLEE